jgi:hypothetical protein
MQARKLLWWRAYSQYGNSAAVDIHLGTCIKKRGSGFCCAGVIFCTESQPDAMKPLMQGGLHVIWAEFKDGRLQWSDRQMQGDGTTKHEVARAMCSCGAIGTCSWQGTATVMSGRSVSQDSSRRYGWLWVQPFVHLTAISLGRSRLLAWDMLLKSKWGWGGGVGGGLMGMG